MAVLHCLELVLKYFQRRHEFLVQLLEILVQSQPLDRSLDILERLSRSIHVVAHCALDRDIKRTKALR